MDSAQKDVRELVLEQIFPELRYGGDPDIERYFELRQQGRMFDALALYRQRLKPRYPDDKKRVVLLALFRTRAPQYQQFLHDLLMERADEIINRLKKNIDALVLPLQNVRMKDTYAVLKMVEVVARMLPVDPEKAKTAAAAYENQASILKYKKTEMTRLCYLLGEFYEQALVEELEAADFLMVSPSIEAERRKQEEQTAKHNFFDISRIEFDAADTKRIEISTAFTRNEDKVLAYCHKYWLRVEDPAFERIIWLYSRKYETQHYDIFRTIKLGRRRKYTDDDILTMVATNLTTKYSYTVQGDIYMQAAWHRIKSELYSGASASAKTNDATKPGPATREAESLRRQRELESAAAESRKNRELPETNTVSRENGPGQAASVDKPESIQGEPKLTRNTEKPKRLAALKTYASLPDRIPTGSISDAIKRLSGRVYDVYHDIFLERVRGAIHEELGKQKKKPATLFDDRMNRAEDLVYRFMEENYTNSYMDWTGSPEHAQVAELGFAIDSLESIIDSCYRKISA